jgi:nucleoside-diphosphate-sugar epimerase
MDTVCYDKYIMKVAITGHTRGIGQALFNELTKKGHLVVGYSRSTGYDISEIDTQTKILEEIKDYDVFITITVTDYC